MAVPRPTLTTMAFFGSRASRSRLSIPAVSAVPGRAITRMSVRGRASSRAVKGRVSSKSGAGLPLRRTPQRWAAPMARNRRATLLPMSPVPSTVTRLP